MFDDLAALFRADGPFVSVYLDARSDQPQAQQQLATRWKTVRATLAGDGAADADVDALDEAVGRATHVGGATLALVAAGGQVRLERHLPEAPRRDAARVGALPWVGPLVASAQHLLPHLVVLADRAGADLYGFDGSGEAVEDEVQGVNQGDVLTRSAPGGWSQRRYQQRAVEAWEENAREVAAEVARIAQELDARLVAVGGDVHAVRLLRADLPADVAPLVHELEGASRHPDGGIDHEAEQARRLVDTVVAEESVALIRTYKDEVGQHDRAATGAARTVEMLQAATVETLLVHDDPDDERRAWFGPEPHHLGLDEATLQAMGVDARHEARLVDVCIRAALGTGAAVRIVPSAILDDGLGAVLRHTGTTPAVPGR